MTYKRRMDVFDAYDRFYQGTKVREDTWDYITVPKNAQEMKERYNLNFGNNIVPTDTDMIDRLFLAGVDMLAITGFYNSDTGTVIHLSEDEIYQGIKNAPKEVKIGNGKEQISCFKRLGNTRRKPIVQGGPTGAPLSEEQFRNIIQSYAQEPVVDTLVSGVLSAVKGHPTTANTPWEIKATMAEIRNVKDACYMAGRPGMGI